MNNLYLITDVVEKVILILMFVLSVWSISIMIDRRRRLKAESNLNFDDLRNLIKTRNFSQAREWCNAHPGFVTKALLEVFDSTQSEIVDRRIMSYLKIKKVDMEKGLSVLATLGANAPFIGLFGTVLGIIRSFAYVGSQAGSSAVMSGVSQALYATAMGLLVAIPAVVAYNYFSKLNRDLVLQVESLRDLYLAEQGVSKK